MRNLILVIYFVIGQYICYDLFGKESSLWILYYFAWPAILAIGVIINELKKTLPLLIKIYYGGVIGVIIFHYLHLASKYEPDRLAFIEKMSERGEIYHLATAYLLVSITCYLLNYFRLLRPILKYTHKFLSCVKSVIKNLYNPIKKLLK